MTANLFCFVGKQSPSPLGVLAYAIMADLRLFSRSFITEFIRLYKSFPCLWKVGSREYSDRAKREQAYDALVAKYREVDRMATRDEVKKKLYGLRSSYRREMAKLKNSIRTGTTLDDVYKPTLWYFYLFDFLSEHETLKEPTSTTDDDQDMLKDEEQVQAGFRLQLRRRKNTLKTLPFLCRNTTTVRKLWSKAKRRPTIMTMLGTILTKLSLGRMILSRKAMIPLAPIRLPATHHPHRIDPNPPYRVHHRPPKG